MKQTIGIIHLLFFLLTGIKSNPMKSNRTVKEQQWQTKRLDIKEIGLIKAANLNKALLIGDEIERAVEVLGLPSKITSQYLEQENIMAKVYHYGYNRLFFIKDRLEEYELSDRRFIVGEINGRCFKVGDKLKSAEITRAGAGVQKYFEGFRLLNPARKTEIRNDNAVKAKEILFGALLKRNLRLLDSYMVLTFNEYDYLVNIKVNR